MSDGPVVSFPESPSIPFKYLDYNGDYTQQDCLRMGVTTAALGLDIQLAVFKYVEDGRRR